jgi:uncharacterized membrane protein
MIEPNGSRNFKRTDLLIKCKGSFILTGVHTIIAPHLLMDPDQESAWCTSEPKFLQHDILMLLEMKRHH